MNPSRTAKNEFMSARIQGAQFFDIDAVSDNTSDLPDMLPSTREFGNYVGGVRVCEMLYTCIMHACVRVAENRDIQCCLTSVECHGKVV